MDRNDSQLSDAIRAARMVTSQNSSFFSDFSQETKDEIENGKFKLFGLDSQDVAELQNEASTSIVRSIESDPEFSVEKKVQSSTLAAQNKFSSPEKDPNMDCLETKEQAFRTESFTFETFSKTAKRQGLTRTKKRLTDLLNFGEIKKEPVVEVSKKSVLDVATAAIDTSLDSLSPPLQLLQPDVTFQNVFSSQERDSTLSQVIWGSQPIDYLRKKTEKEKSTKKRSGPFSVDETEEVVGDGNDFKDFGILPDLSFEITDSAREENLEDENIVRELPIMRISEPEERETMHVFVNDSHSDYVFHELNDCRTMWARHEKLIPMVIEWRTRNESKKLIRIKFKQYKYNETREEDIKLVSNDVKKCSNCIINDGNATKSFLIVDNRERMGPHGDWMFVDDKQEGQFVQCEVEAGVSRLEFNLRFTCREKCMTVLERRKSRCLVFVLKDENGNEILHKLIENVHIVGYPKRDFDNYLAKMTKKADLLSFSKPDIARFNNENDIEMKILQPLNKMRKRTATEARIDEKTSEKANPLANNYQYRLMLGKTPAAEEEPIEDVDGIFAHSETKKRKSSDDNVFSIQFVGEEDRLEYFEFARQKALKERYAAALSSQSTTPHPISLQSSIRLNTPVTQWLSTMDLEHLSQNFLCRSIFKIEQLVQRYERNNQVFETLQLGQQEFTTIFRTFLNFYHPFKADQLKSIHSKTH